jgi:hypothetical protein
MDPDRDHVEPRGLVIPEFWWNDADENVGQNGSHISTRAQECSAITRMPQHLRVSLLRHLKLEICRPDTAPRGCAPLTRRNKSGT